MCDILDKEQILSYTIKGHFENLFVLKTVNSTNLFAKKQANKNFIHETVVVSDTQTEGRGRLGREFFSPKGTGVYMSIVIDPKEIKTPSSLLTIAAAVAMCRTLDNVCTNTPAIKWVNDIFVGGKKVCGILAENVTDFKSSHKAYIVLGIGLNISTPEELFPGELRKVAGSIFPENISRNEIIAQILNNLLYIYNEENQENLIDEYKLYSLVLNKTISFTRNGEANIGTVLDINQEGNLIVKLNNGEIHVLTSGEVSLGSSNFV
jgi:BirA family biotin operon repressor/biotin-[acetyl-CoA-carboxylase] ligase